MEIENFFSLLKAEQLWIEQALVGNNQSPNVSIEQVKSPKNYAEFQEAILSWNYLLTNKDGWQDINCTGNNFPRIFEFSEEVQKGVKFLPLSIEIGQGDGKLAYVKRYHRFYFPELSGVNWSQCLAAFLAPRYKEVSDMGLKEFIAKSAFELIGVESGLVLDAGCGTGLSNDWKPKDVELYGVDRNEKMIEAAVSNGENAFVEDFADPVFVQKHKEQFDGAIVVYVDNWLEDQREIAYKNICECLREKAKIAINIYQPADDWQEYYRKILQNAGFSKIDFIKRKTDSHDGMREINFIVAEK